MERISTMSVECRDRTVCLLNVGDEQVVMYDKNNQTAWFQSDCPVPLSDYV